MALFSKFCQWDEANFEFKKPFKKCVILVDRRRSGQSDGNLISTDACQTAQVFTGLYTYERRKIPDSGIDKICIVTFWGISGKRLGRSYRIPNSRIMFS